MVAPVLASLVGQVQTILRTNQRAYISPTEMGFYIDGAQQYLQNFLLGLVELYQPGRPLPAVASQITSDVNELLEPQRVRFDPTSLGGGKFQIFANTPPASKAWVKIEAYIADEYKVTVPTIGREESYTRSRVRAPSITKPIGQYEGNFVFKVTPAPTLLTVQYIAKIAPTDVAFTNNYTIDENNSTEINWSPRAIPYLLYFVMKNFGISTLTPPLVQYAQQNLQMAI